MKKDIPSNEKLQLSMIRHPLANGIGGVSAALENIRSNPDLAERFLCLALEKFKLILETLDREESR